MKDIERKDTNDVSGGISIVDPYGCPQPFPDPLADPQPIPNTGEPTCPTGTGPIA